MTAKMPTPEKSTPRALASLNTTLGDIYRGIFDITHSGIALVGTTLTVALLVLSMRADLRTSAEQHLLGWLLQRQEAVSLADSDALIYVTEPTAIDRVTAAEPKALPKEQANVAFWLSRKYRVAPEPLSVLVAEAFEIGQKTRLDPTLILAVMAIESRFNPFAQSPVGAQGLMQVMTRVHTDKYEDFGGQLAAFDPVSNLRVGVRVLQECIKRAGSIEGGLRLYVGAVSTDGRSYIDKVMAEHMRIQSVALGKHIPIYTPAPRAIPVMAPTQPVNPTTKPQDELEAEVTTPSITTPNETLAKS
ncbi:MAG: lytic transglycosylase domain-containing protein [Hydrogenophaga sp.]|uniref:lytic transglycosylase domain-containing protein n=1 Tax=Hydrogenophaga sp. TaxID=1904254 RepID=UPI002752CA3B|nr:lytic transglycosylase domain-containing protein [Hydrogenophaga sp.]MDP2418588.1 lytic transglycosylase domain-containing protein [Hydrogenophaga sp.]MDZ4187889.1 lytic transglycosylase domain-containing protein [Hydrogenophaga sp.]